MKIDLETLGGIFGLIIVLGGWGLLMYSVWHELYLMYKKKHKLAKRIGYEVDGDILFKERYDEKNHTITREERRIVWDDKINDWVFIKYEKV